MPKYIINRVKSKPGIQRDGTLYAAEHYVNGQWCRFYEGVPRKIGGYKLLANGTDEIIRSMFAVPKPNSIDLYLGRNSSLNFINLNFNGGGDVEVDRTPTSGFTPDPSGNNQWNFDLFTDTDSSAGVVDSYIVAQVTTNAMDISNTVEGPIFYGNVNSEAPLEQIVYENTDPVLISGGVVFCSPVLVAYGNDGVIRWSKPGIINNWRNPDENFLVVANTKLVNAFRTRGSGAQSILLWSLNSLVRATFIDDETGFTATTIEDDITVLAPNSIVKYNQMFFWIGTDQFYFYNGICQKLTNTMNNDWFFTSVNLSQRAKIFGVAVPAYKEIWWFYPRGSTATECNAVIIYNVEENCWYDSTIRRSSAVQTSIFPRPIMADNELVRYLTPRGEQFGYPYWMHEFGVDRTIGNEQYAIDSYFQTHFIDMFSNDGTRTNMLRNRRVAPDFVQTEEMTLTLRTHDFPKSAPVDDGPYTFTDTTEKIDLGSQGSLISFIFRSNTGGGFFQLGKTLYYYDVGDPLK